MTTGGWIMLTVSWTIIIALSAFCLGGVLRLEDSQADHIKGINKIDTGDME